MANADRVFPISQVEVEGKTAFMTCISRDEPVWTKDSMPVQGHTMLRYTVVLINIGMMHTGNYTCNGTDYISGKKFSADSELLVAKKMRRTESGRHVKIKTKNICCIVIQLLSVIDTYNSVIKILYCGYVFLIYKRLLKKNKKTYHTIKL